MSSSTFTTHANSPVKNWPELVAIEASFPTRGEWAFRGQDVPDYPASSLERHCGALRISGRGVVDLEVKLIREFARRYHLYTGYAPPAKGHTLEWMSLLQHYGTPTRLVDFTYSFFIAAFFALEKPGRATIWAVNVTELHERARAAIVSLPDGQRLWDNYKKKRDGEPFRKLFMLSPRHRFVRPINPLRLNERLSNQRGLFLAPGDVTATFERNLRDMRSPSTLVYKITLNKSCRHEVLAQLDRMNINAATLFPGLEGFAKSLFTRSFILRTLPRQGPELLEEV